MEKNYDRRNRNMAKCWDNRYMCFWACNSPLEKPTYGVLAIMLLMCLLGPVILILGLFYLAYTIIGWVLELKFWNRRIGE